ncbi:MAG: hypothetical protein ACRELE_07315 [Gemmatimonadales bacterium]
MGDLLDFLNHTGERGIMPAATAQALAVAVRNVFSVLGKDEQVDLRQLDVDTVIKRFNNKRAKDFTPSSLKEYGRRAHRATELFLKWRDDPANFSVKTRTTSVTGKKGRQAAEGDSSATEVNDLFPSPIGNPTRATGGYQTSIPIRPGRVVTISNIPSNLTRAEADRLAEFIGMLAVE